MALLALSAGSAFADSPPASAPNTAAANPAPAGQNQPPGAAPKLNQNPGQNPGQSPGQNSTQPQNQARAQAAGQAPAAEHDRAVGLARAGDNDGALAILEKLHRDYPADLGVRRDYCVVLDWAEKYDEALAVWDTLPPNQPAWVVLRAADAYRRKKRYSEAIQLYRANAPRFPDNFEFPAGMILTMTDAREARTALADADQILTKHPDSVPVLLAGGYAAMALKQPTDALAYFNHALKIEPDNAEAHKQQIYAQQAIDVARRKAAHRRKQR